MTLLINLKDWILANKTKTALLVVVLILVFIKFSGSEINEENNVDTLPVVTVTSAADINGFDTASIVGTVRSFNEAVLTAENSGRVTSVNTTLGQTVPAGFIVATLENASERASLLQAEGAYEAALASSRQSTVGLTGAQNQLVTAQRNAISTFQSSYNTVNGSVRNTIDSFFSNPNNRVPGLKIDGKGQTTFLNNERVAYQTLLPTWQQEGGMLTTSSDLVEALNTARARVDRTISMVDVFITLFNAEDKDNSYTTEELLSFSSSFTALRSNLQNTRDSIDNAVLNLENAQDGVRRAEISASSQTETSAADAQVKQALGSLRAAQANLEKTIFRTPISGEVNSLNVRVGDFVSNQDVVARVANNQALEVVTYVGDTELNAFTVGGTVIVENKYEGVVSQIAPAVDPVTRRTEVRIALDKAEEVQNGDTVSITANYTANGTVDETILVPLSAVKFELENGFVFVVENNTLQRKDVTTGEVRGGSIEITSGLTRTDKFVKDARGLLEGTKVEVK